MQITSELGAARDSLLSRLVDGLERDPRVVAAWLCGSFGRGEADEWSDLDLHVALSDEAAAAVVDAPAELFALAGDALLVQGNFPSESLPGGRFWLVVYPGPIEVDWNVGPLSAVMRPQASLLLFEKRPVSVAKEPAGPSEEELRRRAQRDLEFFWAMAPIAAKYCGRGHTRLAVNQCALLERAFVSLWRAVNRPEVLADAYHQNRMIESALDAVLPRFGAEINAEMALVVVGEFCVQVELLHRGLTKLGVEVPLRMAAEVRSLIEVGRVAVSGGSTRTGHGSRR